VHLNPLLEKLNTLLWWLSNEQEKIVVGEPIFHGIRKWGANVLIVTIKIEHKINEIGQNIRNYGCSSMDKVWWPVNKLYIDYK
jgi:hypothetical protein